MNDLKMFTLEEANGLVPVLSNLIQTLRKKKHEIAQIEVEIDALEMVANNTDPKTNQELSALIERHQVLVAEFYSAVDQIHSHKCFLKDIDRGLVDFYGSVDGRIVYYCWNYGEDKIRFWHEIGQGFDQRQPLQEKE